MFLPLIVGLAFILLLPIFRSILVPIQAVIGFLLTLAAAFGAVVWIFDQGHLNGLLGVPATAPIASFLPIIMIAILSGLAMDYEVFLVSRMREQYVRGGEPSGAVIRGFSLSARVVTAAAIIMASVFASFIAGDDLIIKSFGVALAFGVLVDAFLVRMTLVPAMLALSGRRAWYLPRSLEGCSPISTPKASGSGHSSPHTSPSESHSRPVCPRRRRSAPWCSASSSSGPAGLSLTIGLDLCCRAAPIGALMFGRCRRPRDTSGGP